MNRLNILVFALAAIACSKPPAAPPAQTSEPASPQRNVQCVPAANRLCPVDQASSDPTFGAFRDELLAAVRARDAARLAPLVDAHVRTSFGEDRGKLALDDRTWKELDAAITLGGAFREGMFWAPYVYAVWPESVDAFEHVAAIRPGVVIEDKPNGREVARVDWEILALVRGEVSTDWTHVRTAAGVEGWVRAADVRSPIAHRAGFSKRSGSWKLEAFVAGD